MKTASWLIAEVTFMIGKKKITSFSTLGKSLDSQFLFYG